MAREKTAPHSGSTRQGKIRTMQPGKPQACADEWKGMGSGAHTLKMIADGATDEEKTERLWQKYKDLPRGKQKQDLKQRAKKHEEEQRERWQKWLHNGPSG